jgi:basic membrane protein A and related proteins
MIRFAQIVFCAAFSAVITATAALADPAIVYSVGGKFDGSFNESAYSGVMRFSKEADQPVREFTLERDAQSLQALRNFASRGSTPVVAIGFNQANALGQVAPEFPETDFAIIDMVVDQPNVRSYVFKEQEGAYIGGLLAAMASRSGTIGFVGGMDIPIIQRFLCGYKQGALSVNPDIKVLSNMTGDTPAAFADPVRGGELATGQIKRGADVVLQAAGGTGLGVLQAVADADVLGIGTDSNQNGLHPGKVLTSIRKRVDNAVYDSFQSAKDGSFSPGIQVLGLAEGGMDWVLDDNNKILISSDMKQAADAAVKNISDGTVKVHDVVTEGACPF